MNTGNYHIIITKVVILHKKRRSQLSRSRPQTTGGSKDINSARRLRIGPNRLRNKRVKTPEMDSGFSSLTGRRVVFDVFVITLSSEL